jgi:hypothetical protein
VAFRRFDVRPAEPDQRAKAKPPRGVFTASTTPSTRDAHQRLLAPAMIRAARRSWPGRCRALIPNGQSLQPSIADTATPRRDAAADTASARSRRRFGNSAQREAGSKAGFKAGEADHHRGSSSARVQRSNISVVNIVPARRRTRRARPRARSEGLKPARIFACPIEKGALEMGGGAASRAKRPLAAQYSGGTSCHLRDLRLTLSLFLRLARKPGS